MGKFNSESEGYQMNVCVCWGGYNVQCALCDTGEVVVKSTVYITMSGLLHSTRITYPNTSHTTSTH